MWWFYPFFWFFYIDQRVFDIEADVSDNKAAYITNKKALTERSTPKSTNSFDFPLKTGNIKTIEEIEKIANMSKLSDSIKEIKIKPRENINFNQLDFSCTFKKVYFYEKKK